MKLRYKITAGLFLTLFLAISALALAISYTNECTPAPTAAAGTESMQSIVYTCYGSPEVLQLAEVEKPVPAADEVLVRVSHASVNPMDYHYMRGAPYVMRLMAGLGAPKDIKMGADFAGTVEAVGSEVTRLAPGDRVFGARSGAFGQYVTVRQDRAVLPIPDGVSAEQTAALPVAAVTAIQAIRDKGELKPGQKVLVNGASGGVGTYAVQIAKAMGAEVHGVCSGRNVELVKSLGATRVFNYKQEDYTESGEQYDLIIDNVGNHSALANARVMTDEGRLVMVGGAKGDWLGPFVGNIMARLTDPFVPQTYLGLLAILDPVDLAELADMMAAGELRSVIDQRYSLEDTAAAMTYSESGRVRGKLIIEIP